MKVLQLSFKLPLPVTDGGAYAIHQNTAALLRNGVQVKMLAVEQVKSGENIAQVPGAFRKQVALESVRVDNRVHPVKAALNLFSDESYLSARFYSEEFNTRLIQILQAEEYDVVLLENLYMCNYLRTIRKYSTARIVLRPQNVEHLLWEDQLNTTGNLFARTFLSVAVRRLKKFEEYSVRNVDGILTLTEQDADYFRAHTSREKVLTIPLGVDADKYAAIDRGKQYSTFPVFYHLGSMDWRPNIDALRWFTNEIFPLVHQAWPDFRFAMAGKNMPAEFMRMNSSHLHVEGTVPDAIAWQEDKAVLVVPLRVAGGIRIKMLEAMAMGKTVISTSVGAQGIPYTDGENILIADTPEEFVRQIGKCKASETFCRRTGESAREMILRECSTEVAGKRMVEFFEKCCAERTGGRKISRQTPAKG